MAKNLSIRFRAASSSASITSAAVDETLGDVSTSTEDSSIQLLVGHSSADIEPDSDSPEEVFEESISHCGDSSVSSNLNDGVECLPPTIALEVSESTLFDPVDSKKKRKKSTETVGAKVDKFVRQLQESFTLSSSSVSTSSTSASTNTTVYKVNKAEGSSEKTTSGDLQELDDSSVVSISIGISASPTLTTTANQHVSKASSAPATPALVVPAVVSPNPSTAGTWFNEMKLSHLNVLRDRLRTEKRSTGEESKVGSNCGVSAASGGQVTCTTCSDQPQTGIVTPSFLLVAPLADTEETELIDPVSSNGTKDKKNKEMIFKWDKDSKKGKQTEKSKKAKAEKDDASKGVNNLMKIISPVKSGSFSFSTPAPTTSVSNSNGGSNLAAFLSPFTSSLTKTTSTTTTPARSRSASTEHLNLDDTQVLPTNGPTKNLSSKGLKMSSSRSMISFRKLMKNEENIFDDDQVCSILMQPPASTTNANPTLRRRAATSSRRDSPVGGETHSVNDDVLDSTASSSSNSVDCLLDDPLPDTSNSDVCGSNTKQTETTRQSLWKSWISSSFIYGLFAIVFVVTLLFCFLSKSLSSFFSGFILGILLTLLVFVMSILYVITNFFLMKSSDSESKRRTNGQTEGVSLRRTRSTSRRAQPFLNLAQVPGATAEGNVYMGWVDEFIGDYEDREKSGFRSRSVYMMLNGSKLYVFTLSQELNEKRLKQLSLDSNRNMPNFATQRIIDLARLNHKVVTLHMTQNVRNRTKYIWNKKYPICIQFNDDGNGAYTVIGKESESGATADRNYPTSHKLVIFARTCREKEEWFWALRSSIEATTSGTKCSNSAKSSILSLADSANESMKNLEQELLESEVTSQQYLTILTRRLNYHSFMRTNVLNAEGLGLGPGGPGMMTPLTWFNVLLNRLSFDILNKPNWSAYIAKKLQRKLRRLRLPYFMESLTITEIDIGDTLPKFNSVPSVPVVDDAGLWIDFDVSYSGGFTMTLETKINLMKLKTEAVEVSTNESSMDTSDLGRKKPNNFRHWGGYKYRSSVSATPSGLVPDGKEEICDNDSDLDSIVTSSEDEEPETAPADPDDADTDEKQKKLIRWMSKITTKASQINLFKKALDSVSKMSIMLTVQINSLNGTLAINIPEPPSDRLWYGFRPDPTLQITAKPKLGDHDVNMSYVTNFIEKKLCNEFFNYFVIPNMDDLFIPALNTNIEQFISMVP